MSPQQVASLLERARHQKNVLGPSPDLVTSRTWLRCGRASRSVSRASSATSSRRSLRCRTSRGGSGTRGGNILSPGLEKSNFLADIAAALWLSWKSILQRSQSSATLLTWVPIPPLQYKVVGKIVSKNDPTRVIWQMQR